MDRIQKKAWIKDFSEDSSCADIVIVTHYKGLTVAQMTALRGKIRACGATFKVTKNSLAKLALKDGQFAHLDSFFVGPTAVAYANDPVAAAKVLAEFAKTNDKLVLLGASFAGKVLEQKELQELAKLPSLDELRAKIIAIINTPAVRIAGVTQAPAGQLARVFSAYGASQS
ncbi:MAG: 50S ribosomal protein L10 [Alphaproteobacteria bacterium]|nr:MAG: 50S ribosomal protein L10 [Alphaproteobacteria bacterium]TAF14371.1 MAG: 50S ribosomal protein L10 [Alphaproteobacteria bacterium]TAF75711.1 MAG: 50S ribosomal protein L10 [Alphaproteobacteria bacterium]